MRIVFMGTPQAAVPTLERILADGHEVAAVYSQPDRPSGRGNKVSFSPVKQFALDNELPVFQPQKIKIPETIEIFRSHNADTAVVVAYGRILPETFLNAYPKGAINVHFSLLPKYRGAAPVNWAIVNGETRTGVTTMRMDAGLDTGGMLLKRETGIGAAETAPELMQRLAGFGADLLSETLAMYNELVPQPQDDTLATFAPIMKKEDGLIDWNRTALEIANRVRGFQPFPTAFTSYSGKKLTIWQGEPAGVTIAGNPGEIIEAKGNGFVVTCGKNTALRVSELQIEGKRRMPVSDFLNGNKVQAGDVLG
jgi:methionyl-tRNA formyltransferase